MFLQKLNDYSENDLVLKLVDDFLASRYASLTTKSSNFGPELWETLTNFKKISLLESTRKVLSAY